MIGIFDSGVGGLSIYKACKKKLPGASFLYFSDHEHFPYGEKTPEEIQNYAMKITDFLLSKGSQLIVIACNAATISSIGVLRKKYPVQFVGTEPAVKPASLATKTKKIAVLLTNAASVGQTYQELVSKWNHDVQVYSIPMPKLVQLIEDNAIQTDSFQEYLTGELDKILQLGIDTIVLGCTHFIFIKPYLLKHYNKHFTILDPTEGVSNQTKRLYSLITEKKEIGGDSFYTSGNPDKLENFLQNWLKINTEVNQVSF